MFRLRILLVFLATAAEADAAVQTLELEGGDRLTGEVLLRSDDQVVLQHPVLGRLEIPADRVVPEKGPRPGLFGTRLLEAWDRQVQLGVSGSKGNTEETDVNLALRLAHEDETERWLVRGLYDYSQASRVTNEHDAHLDVTRDWLSPERKWFPFVYGAGDYDEFKGWRYRASAFVGLGRTFDPTPAWHVQLRAGLGGAREWGDSDDLRPEATLRFDAHWKPKELHEVRLYAYVYPYLDDLSEYRTETGVEWQIELDEELGLHLVLGISDEFESQKSDDREERNDFKYRAAIGWDF